MRLEDISCAESVPLFFRSLHESWRNAMKWATKWQQIDNKKDPILLESISQECSYINGFEYGGGGIRTHGALADTLVFKPSRV